MFYLSNHKASTTAGAKVIKNWIALHPQTSIVILIRFLYAAPSYFSLKQSAPCKLTLPTVGKENSNFLISRLLFSMSQAYQPVTLHFPISGAPDSDLLPQYGILLTHTQQTSSTFIFLCSVCQNILTKENSLRKWCGKCCACISKETSLDLNWKQFTHTCWNLSTNHTEFCYQKIPSRTCTRDQEKILEF